MDTLTAEMSGLTVEMDTLTVEMSSLTVEMDTLTVEPPSLVGLPDQTRYIWFTIVGEVPQT